MTGWALDLQQMRDLPVAFCAEAAHDNEVLRAFERPMFAPVFDNAVGQAGADAGQCFELRGSGGVEIYGRSLRECLSCRDGTNQQHAQAESRQPQISNLKSEI